MKNWIKSAFIDLYQAIRPHKSAILTALAGLALFSQLNTINYYLVKNIGSREVVYTVHNDAARAIKTAQETAWYKSNHFYPYGNVYFRLAHTLEAFSPKTFAGEGLDASEADEKSNHYALMLASLVSLYALAFLLAALFVQSMAARLVLCHIFAAAFLQNQVWTDLLLTAHPDHLFAFLIAAATAASAKLLKYPQNKFYFVASAILWGVATATKMTMVLFLPAIFFLHLYPFSKQALQRFIRYAALMFLAYQVIGFPQNLSIHRHIGFLLHQAHNSVSPDMQSLLEWLRLGWEQIKYPGLFALLFTLGLRRGSKLLPLGKTAVFIGIPVAVLLSRKIMSVHDYYPMPYVAMLLVGLALLGSRVNTQRFLNPKVKVLLVLLAFAASIWRLNPGMQESLAASYAKSSHCVEQAKEVQALVRKRQQDGAVAQVDPYFPLGTKSVKHHRSWGYTLEDLKKNDPDVIGLRQKFYERYLSPPADFLKKAERDNWGNIGDYYRLFHGQKRAKLGDAAWSKIRHDRCGFIVFEKVSQE